MTVEDILGAFGLSGDIAIAVAQAELDPTSANVNNVIAVYAVHHMTPPGDLLAHLLLINEQRHPEDTVKGKAMPWVIAGAAVIWFLIKRR